MKEMLPLMQKKSTILFLHQPPTTLSGPSVLAVLGCHPWTPAMNTQDD